MKKASPNGSASNAYVRRPTAEELRQALYIPGALGHDEAGAVSIARGKLGASDGELGPLDELHALEVAAGRENARRRLAGDAGPLGIVIDRRGRPWAVLRNRQRLLANMTPEQAAQAMRDM